jgi:hypothetical protein
MTSGETVIDLLPGIPSVWGWKRAKSVDIAIGDLQEEGFFRGVFGRDLGSSFRMVSAIQDDATVGQDIAAGSGAFYLTTVAHRNGLMLEFGAEEEID